MILIDRAIRGEGTSHAYLPPTPMATADPGPNDAVHRQFADPTFPVVRGIGWTTDAPFRETAAAQDDDLLALSGFGEKVSKLVFRLGNRHRFHGCISLRQAPRTNRRMHA